MLNKLLFGIWACTMAAWHLVARTRGAFDAGELERMLAVAGLSEAKATPTLEGLRWIAEATRP